MREPEEVYATLKDRIMSADIDSSYDTHQTAEFVCDIDEWYARVECGVSLRYVDESFSHFFGTETKGHWEVESIDSITDSELVHCADGTEEIMPFDDEAFLTADTRKSIDNRRYREYLDNSIREFALSTQP